MFESKPFSLTPATTCARKLVHKSMLASGQIGTKEIGAELVRDQWH